MTLVRRRLLLAGLGLAATGLARPAWAGRKLALMVGAAAGSDADLRARAFAPFLERHLPHTRIEVVNLPAEGGLAALRAVAGDTAGAALGWVATPSLPARMIDTLGVAGMAARLALVGAVQREPVVFAAMPGGPGTMAELLARVAADGQAAGLAQVLGTPPPGSAAYLAALRLQALAGRRLNIVAFPSAGAARQAAAAGNLAAAALAFGTVRPALNHGKLVALPAMAALDAAALIHRGLAVAGGDAQRQAMLQAALQAVVADPEFQDQAAADGFTGQYLAGPAWMARAATERDELARLWLATPWRGAGIG